MFRCSCKKKKKILSALKIQRQGWELPFCFTFPLFRTLGFSQASTTAHAVCSDKELTLLFLYSSCTVGPESSQPPGQLSSNLHITSSQPASQAARLTLPCSALLCPAQNWLSAGVIRVSALLACPCAKPVCKHQAETCKFIDLHLY